MIVSFNIWNYRSNIIYGIDPRRGMIKLSRWPIYQLLLNCSHFKWKMLRIYRKKWFNLSFEVVLARIGESTRVIRDCHQISFIFDITIIFIFGKWRNIKRSTAICRPQFVEMEMFAEYGTAIQSPEYIENHSVWHSISKGWHSVFNWLYLLNKLLIITLGLINKWALGYRNQLSMMFVYQID